MRIAEDPVLAGLAENPALPDELLLRLIREHGPAAARGLARRVALPGAALAAMLAHQDPGVRAAVAENRSVDPAIRLGLVHDPHHSVRARAAGQRDLDLPEADLMQRLARAEWFRDNGMLTPAEFHGEVQDEVHRDRRLLRVLARHPEAGYRLLACTFGEQLDEDSRAVLLGDPAPQVRAAVAERLAEDARLRTVADLDGLVGRGRRYAMWGPLSPELIDLVLSSGDVDALLGLADNRRLPAGAVEALTGHPDPGIRRQAAGRPDLTAEQAARLAADPAPEVRARVSVHPALTEEQRAAIGVAVDPDDFRHERRRPEPGQAVAWARSVNPVLRRWAAMSGELPDDLARELTEDPEPSIRAAVAVHHPAVPPEALLRIYLAQSYDRYRIRALPHFPAAGLARRFAHDGDEDLRILAALDPEAGPSIAAHLLTDPDRGIRAAAAANPGVPAGRLVALLDDPELRRIAAANPSLPVAEMERRISRGPAGSAP